MSARPWYREPMLALVIGLPAAAVVAGIATVVLAVQSSGDTGDPRVRRVAQVQTTDLAMDREAARLGLAPALAIAPDGVVTVAFQGGQLQGDTLQLTLRHGTDPARDREVLLSRAGEYGYAGLLPAALAAGAYNVELAPRDGGWRVVGRLEDGESRLRLAPAVEE
jgi:hypothetical protein